MQSVASVRPFASSPFAEPTDLLYVHGSRRQLAGIESQGQKSMQNIVLHDSNARAGFKCVEALGRIIIRGPHPPLNAIIYMY